MSGKIIAVFYQKGGMGDVGKHVVKHCLQQDGLEIRATARNGEDIESSESVTKVKVKGVEGEERLTLIDADPIKEIEKLKETLKGVDFVVSCIGNRQPGFARWAGPGTENIIEAMKANGVSRLIMLSSVGVAESWPPMRWTIYGSIFACLFRTLIRSALRDLNRAEKAVRNSGLDYLIVRPTGLTPAAQPKGVWKTIKEPGQDTVDFQIAKEDVSLFILQEAITPTLRKEAVTIGWPN